MDKNNSNTDQEKLINKTEVGRIFLFDKSIFDKITTKQPYYAMAVDNHNKDALVYCLSRKIDGVVEILLCKTMRDEKEFNNEFENLAKYFNADIFQMGN